MRIAKMNWLRYLAILALIAFAVVSVLQLSHYASSPRLYSRFMDELDEQKQNAMMLSAVVTVASTAISAIPDDTATPIANQLSELSTPLLIIVVILYVEKYLLTTMGFVSTAILIPAACLCGILYLLFERERFKVWLKKLVILSLALILIVPLSVGAAMLIEETFSESVNETYHAAYELSQETQTEDKEGKNGFFAFFAGIKDNVAALIDKAKSMLSILVDAVAVLLVTSCVIPLLTALVFIAIVKNVFKMPVITAVVPPKAPPALPDAVEAEA